MRELKILGERMTDFEKNLFLKREVKELKEAISEKDKIIFEKDFKIGEMQSEIDELKHQIEAGINKSQKAHLTILQEVVSKRNQRIKELKGKIKELESKDSTKSHYPNGWKEK